MVLCGVVFEVFVVLYCVTCVVWHCVVCEVGHVVVRGVVVMCGVSCVMCVVCSVCVMYGV